MIDHLAVCHNLWLKCVIEIVLWLGLTKKGSYLLGLYLFRAIFLLWMKRPEVGVHFKVTWRWKRAG